MYLESGEKPPPAVRKEVPDFPFYLREWDRLEIREGILCRRRQDGDSITYQMVLPEEFRSFVMSELHDQMGHMGMERTLDLVRSRCYWPRMSSEVEHKVRTCRRKALPQKAAPLVNIQVTRPLELVCMDFLSLEPDKSNTQNILVITDFFHQICCCYTDAQSKSQNSC